LAYLSNSQGPELKTASRWNFLDAGFPAPYHFEAE